jgi:1-pyrroline-5-carboxylate dehydrogenase
LCYTGLEKKLAEIASKRSMKDLTVGPVLTWSTEAMLGHVDKLLQIPGLSLISDSFIEPRQKA